jgi:tetratricopeptide (TPR) repeat protein
MRSDRGVNAETAAPILKDAIPIGERYPDDAVVQGWLAEMALDAGRYDLAEAAADRALAINPKSSQALIYKAQVRINRAREAKVTDRAVWDEARKWLLRANRIDPNDAYTLLLYYSSFGMAGMVPTANAKDALARAHELVPQDSQLRFAYAYQSLADDRVEDAKLALRPLAYSAHAAPDNKAAQMLAMLEAKKSAREVMGAQTISISGSPQAD